MRWRPEPEVRQAKTKRKGRRAAAEVASDAPGDFEQTPGEEEPEEVRVALHACTRPHDEQQDEEAVREL